MPRNPNCDTHWAWLHGLVRLFQLSDIVNTIEEILRFNARRDEHVVDAKAAAKEFRLRQQSRMTPCPACRGYDLERQHCEHCKRAGFLVVPNVKIREPRQ